MRLNILDDRRGILSIRIESSDDLWLLSLLISPGDVVKAPTTRDVSIGDEKRRIPMVLAVKVAKIEFQPFTNRLRIHGVVIEGPDRFGVLGAHHTLSVGVGTEVTVYKATWDRKIIDEILRFVRPVNILLVAVDFDEYSIALLQMQGIKFVESKEVSVPVSDEGFEEAKTALVNELAKKIVEVVRRYNAEAVVIGSPGDLKNEIKMAVEEIDKGVRVYLDSTASGGYAGIQELLNRGVVGSVIRDSAIAKAVEVLEEFERLLAKDIGMVAYGLDAVDVVARMGAVKKLLIVDEVLSGFDEVRKRAEAMLREVVSKGGSVVIVPSDTPIGERVRMLGGAVAILRYPVDIDQLTGSQLST